MSEIGLLYDQSETDELGIKLTAEQMDIDLVFLPFLKSAFTFNKNGYLFRTIGKNYTPEMEEVKVVLNRCQSKNRRQHASSILESIDIDVLNPQIVEYNCSSKLRTLLAFAKAKINIPKTVYVAANVKESMTFGGTRDYLDVICDLIKKDFPGSVVVKPDAGTHGKSVSLSIDRDELKRNIDSIGQDTTNPSGIIAQEHIPKWFFDLRIIVVKKKGSAPFCYEDALARGNLNRFRTNTFLGSMVFRAELPKSVRENAVKCAKTLGEDKDSWLIALDAMPYFSHKMMQCEVELRTSFDALEKPFDKVKRVKSMPSKKRRFKKYTKDVTLAYNEYMETRPYKHIQFIINDSIKKLSDKIFFFEGNACPEFWEQTRVVAGLNLAEDLLECALSLLDN